MVATPHTAIQKHPNLENDITYDLNKWMKYGIWIYFFLLIFEGALRKWFFPSLATPLLLIRDPIAIYLIISLWKKGQLPFIPYLAAMVLIGILAFITALLFGHGNIPVAIFGTRILIIQFPLIFVIGKVFDGEDVIKIGKVLLWLAIPMTILITLQFYSPQSAWVNRGVGGDLEGAGFDGGAFGFFRPPGTFSFTTGTSQFYALTGCFIFYFWLNPKGISRIILIAATAGLLAAIPLSISRALLGHVIITIIFVIIAISLNIKHLGKLLLGFVGGLIALTVLMQTGFFQNATEVFISRIESANSVEGGMEGVLVDRYLGGMVGALTVKSDLPFFGYGIGMGTNAGSVLMTGEKIFLVSEGEWGRLIGELGSLLGIIVILLRLGISGNLAVASFNKLTIGDLLPWLLLSNFLLIFPQGQWAQPTTLGFSILIGGLMLASLK